MRNFQRERRLTWYMLVLECVAVLYALYINYAMKPAYFIIHLIIFVALVVVTRILTVVEPEECSDFKQGAITIVCGMYVYMCYSIVSGSDRLLPACMFFVMVECTIYKDIQLNIFITAMNVFVSILTLILSGVGIIEHTYRWIEFLFILTLMLVSAGFMLFMQTKDLFTERVAKEDEKSLDDLLQLVEMKCEDATAAAEAKSSFLANMSHEIRTPINAVLGMNEMILREEQDEEIRGYAQNIQSAGTTLLSLVNDILDISKIESGKMEVVPEKYELNSMLYDILLVVQPRIQKKNLQLVLDIDEKIPNGLYGDEVRIRQIITNILTNAVKYTEKGSVTLRVQMKKKDSRHVILEVAVKDTGIGIRESRDVLFASFQRGRDLKAHHIEGTGLGLAITQQLLEMMGSTLEMESIYGKGSRFSFELEQKIVSEEPMGNLNDLYQKRHAQEQKYKESFTAPDAHVLVVDDNPMNRKVVKSLLKQTQIQIDTAEDGICCLEMCAKQRYDLILMDHLMPNKDGVETFRELRADDRGCNYHTPVIILTANAVAGMRQQYLDEGFDGFLSKPVQPQLLEETLRQFLPPELVHLTETDGADDAAEQERQELLQEKIDETGLTELALEDALQYSSGRVEDVLENIKGYLNEAQENDGKMHEAYVKRDWKNLKIHVHALKSTSRVIGAVHMAYCAEKMEMAAADADTSYIDGNMEEVLQEHRQLCESLRALLALPEIYSMAPDATEVEQQRDIYVQQAETFLHGVEEYEVDFEQLRIFCNYYPTGDPLRKERALLAHAVEDFDYEKTSERLSQIIEGLKES